MSKNSNDKDLQAARITAILSVLDSSIEDTYDEYREKTIKVKFWQDKIKPKHMEIAKEIDRERRNITIFSNNMSTEDKALAYKVVLVNALKKIKANGFKGELKEIVQNRLNLLNTSLTPYLESIKLTTVEKAPRTPLSTKNPVSVDNSVFDDSEYQLRIAKENIMKSLNLIIETIEMRIKNDEGLNTPKLEQKIKEQILRNRNEAFNLAQLNPIIENIRLAKSISSKDKESYTALLEKVEALQKFNQSHRGKDPMQSTISHQREILKISTELREQFHKMSGLSKDLFLDDKAFMPPLPREAMQVPEVIHPKTAIAEVKKMNELPTPPKQNENVANKIRVNELIKQYEEIEVNFKPKENMDISKDELERARKKISGIIKEMTDIIQELGKNDPRFDGIKKQLIEARKDFSPPKNTEHLVTEPKLNTKFKNINARLAELLKHIKTEIDKKPQLPLPPTPVAKKLSGLKLELESVHKKNAEKSPPKTQPSPIVSAQSAQSKKAPALPPLPPTPQKKLKP